MVRIRVIEKNGKFLGKTTIILAGIHGNEICGIKALDNLIPKIEIEYGKVIFIYANLEAIKQDKRFIERNLNRCFFKQQSLDIINTLEGQIAREIISYLDSADFMLDLHASNIPDSFPFVICNEKNIENARIFYADFITYSWDSFEPGSTDYYMNLRDKPCFCFEAGYLGDLSSIIRSEKAIISFLKFTGNISGKINKNFNQKILKIKLLYKNNKSFFRKKEYRPDFWVANKKTLIGYEGEAKVFVNSGDRVLFLKDSDKLGQECFLLARDVENIREIKNEI